MRALVLVWALVLALATPAAADGAFDIAPTAECHAAGGGMACVGLAAQACPGGDAADMEACLRAEADWWEAERLAAQAIALRHLQGRDSATWENPPPSMAEGLRDMERAWTAYRAARCDLELARWWEHPAAAQHRLICLMRVTAAEVAVLGDIAGE